MAKRLPITAEVQLMQNSIKFLCFDFSRRIRAPSIQNGISDRKSPMNPIIPGLTDSIFIFLTLRTIFFFDCFILKPLQFYLSTDLVF